jgi:diguanylate cyclase (GGDEF)-like protein
MPSQVLDIRTLLIMMIVISTLLGGLCIAFSRRERGAAALRSWGAGHLGVAGSFAILVLPFTPRFSLLNAAGNALMVAALVLIGRGVRVFLGTQRRDLLGWGLVAAGFAWSVFFHAVQPSFKARTVMITAMVGFLTLRGAWELMRGERAAALRPSQPFTAVCLGVFGLANLVRSAGLLFVIREWRPSLMHNSLFDGLFFLTATAANVSATVGLIWMEIQRLQLRLVEAATHDHLTGALNRAALREAYEREASRSRRSGQPFAVAIFDVDGFKDINDRHGHPGGDGILCGVVETLRGTIRKHDVLGRFGGDEFALLMPEADAEAALAISERARLAVAGAAFTCGTAVERVTISAGLAIHGPHGGDWESLLSAADRALYEAKSGGRNRVVLSSASSRAARVVLTH